MIELLDEKQQERCWSMEAEAGVLGSMIIERDCIGSILGIVQADDFYSPENQIIFTALMELYMGGAPTDPVGAGADHRRGDWWTGDPAGDCPWPGQLAGRRGQPSRGT